MQVTQTRKTQLENVTPNIVCISPKVATAGFESYSSTLVLYTTTRMCWAVCVQHGLHNMQNVIPKVPLNRIWRIALKIKVSFRWPDGLVILGGIGDNGHRCKESVKNTGIDEKTENGSRESELSAYN